MKVKEVRRLMSDVRCQKMGRRKKMCEDKKRQNKSDSKALNVCTLNTINIMNIE